MWTFSLIFNRSGLQSHSTILVHLSAIRFVLHKANVSRVPPNCRFEVDDFEQPWSFSQPFDYIHGRELEGAIRNHEQLFQQAFDNLNPNGWFEMATMEVNTYSDDDTHLKAACLLESVKHMHASSRMFGKDMSSVLLWKERMEKAGFVNVREEVFKVCPSVGTQRSELRCF